LKLNPKVVAPIALFSASVAVAGLMISSRPAAESVRPPVVAPPVRVTRVEPVDAEMWVSAQGTVEPRTESELVTEVAGRIVWASPELASGGFFGTDEPLARIDPRDYAVALDGAKAALARAHADLTHAKADLRRQESMRQSGASSRALLDDAVHAEATAKAGVREAEVATRRAELDMERCEIRAPFAGRVREKRVDIGQFVNRGDPVARVYSTDYVEIRLPIHDADIAYLDLPARFRADGEPAPAAGGPRVVISAEIAGRPFSWDGRVVRTEGALDPRTRMTHVVARVDDPYARAPDSDRPPLSIGLFVEASIEGRVAQGVFEIPRRALRHGSELLVVDSEDRLRVRRVDVLRSDRDRSWLRSGVAAGERVVTSPMEVATEGMRVRVVDAPESAAPEAEARS
jgi:multidrug efflux system membrane fusion protein